MDKELRVAMVIFGGMSKEGQSGLSFFHYRFSKYFHDKGILSSVYTIHADKDISFNGVKINSLLNIKLFKILFKLFRGLRGIVPGFSVRLTEEKVFDWYFERKLRLEKINLLISTKPVNPAIIHTAKSMGCKVIVIATVAHPLFIRGVIEQMEKRYLVNDTSSYSNQTRIKRLIDVYQNADMIIPRIPSTFVFQSYLTHGIQEERLGRPESNILFMLDEKLYNLEERKSNSEKLIFVTSGFMNLKKGLPLLLEAWNDLFHNQKVHGCELHIVGSLDGPTTTVIKNLGMAPNIVLKGYQRHISLMYKSSNIFIASSVSDLGPRTVQEAMACGLPVIVSRNCGTAEFVKEGKTGFLYDPFDIETLKGHILWFINNKDEITHMGKEAAASLQQKTPGDFSEEVYLQCLSLLSKSSLVS